MSANGSVADSSLPSLRNCGRWQARLQPVTLAEAAQSLGVSPETLRWQVRNGKLKARKVGPIWTVTPKEVERYRRESKRL
jgi:excisionase family DNA binding protein